MRATKNPKRIENYTYFFQATGEGVQPRFFCCNRTILLEHPQLTATQSRTSKIGSPGLLINTGICHPFIGQSQLNLRATELLWIPFLNLRSLVQRLKRGSCNYTIWVLHSLLWMFTLVKDMEGIWKAIESFCSMISQWLNISFAMQEVICSMWKCNELPIDMVCVCMCLQTYTAASYIPPLYTC